MSLERVRPLARWAIGRPNGPQGMVVIRLECEAEGADTFVVTAAEAKRLAKAILGEARPPRPH